MSSEKNQGTRVENINAGEAIRITKTHAADGVAVKVSEGQVQKSLSSTSKPNNLVPPKTLPIPPAPANSNTGKK